ncbi:MAG: hypothetical protein ACKVQW_11130 [Pyrinomonadaceae bacterium]
MNAYRIAILSLTLPVFVFSFLVGLPEIDLVQSGRTSARDILAHPVATPKAQKVMSEYRGISIGMKTDEVRSKLGEPKDKSVEMDMYSFAETETAQFYYESQVVKAMMITFTGDLKAAPTPRDVFGEDAAVKEDGSIFKMVRYPKAGYWISYNRSGGTDQVISIAFQKI